MMTSSLFKKIVRSDVLALSLIFLVFQLVFIGSVCFGEEVIIDCDQLLLNEPFKHYDPESIKKIQNILWHNVHGSVPIDGIVGPLTIAAAKEYCHISESYKLTEQDLEILKSQSEVPEEDQQQEEKVIPDEIIEMLKLLQSVEYPNEELFRQALTVTISELNEQEKTRIEADKARIKQYISLIVNQAEKKHAFSDYKDSPINWTGGSCGCVLEDLSGVVYGFYPFWLAGEEKTIDFSVLSRIGYYVVSLDKRGNIVDGRGNIINFPDLDKVNGMANFINEARDHRTKMDLVVYVDKWTEWRQLHEREFDELTDNIVRLITQKLTNRFLNRIKPVITFGGKPVPPVWDGITLYFKSPEEGDGEARNSFVTFIRDLRDKLKAAGNDYDLNILLPMDAVGKGLFGFENLSRLIPEEKNRVQNYVDYFLVFLAEPTTDTKKALRQKIETDFKGIQRKSMLRKIIPVITPTGHDEQQLKDDLIYFDDNFGGVGIWPLPLTTGADSEAGDGTDIKRIGTEVINEILKEGKEPVWDTCKFVCPKLWYFRIAWDMSLAILAVLCLCYFMCCKVRYISHSYRIYSWLVLAALLLLSVPLHVVLLECDPYRSFEITDRVTIIGGVVYAAALVTLWQLFGKKGEQP